MTFLIKLFLAVIAIVIAVLVVIGLIYLIVYGIKFAFQLLRQPAREIYSWIRPKKVNDEQQRH